MAVMIYSQNTSLAIELLTAAKLYGQDVKAVSINDEKQAVVLKDYGADVYSIKTNSTTADTLALAEILKRAAAELEADIVMLSSDRRGKELAGRLAQKLNAGCLTDIKAIYVKGSDVEFERNAFGGATIATQSIIGEKKVLTISPKAFKPSTPDAVGKISDFPVDEIEDSLKVNEVLPKAADTVDISDAKFLIAVGCGVQKSDYLPVIETIAENIGARVGCSKPVASDWKWFPEDRIIGLSGKICNPDIAVILGVSGQVQFAVGVRSARILISINIDENAPINGMADYYLTADLSEVLPQIIGALAKE